MMKVKPRTSGSENRRSPLAKMLFGSEKRWKQRLTSAAFALLLLVSAVLAAAHLSFGDRLATVRADQEDVTDMAEGVSDSDLESSPAYGHIYIDNDPENVLEEEGPNANAVTLCHQSFELYPDENEKDKTVTLYGMMPEGVSAEAVDVSLQYPKPDDVSEETHEDAAVIAAYNITILDGEDEYQPDQTCPIRVEITDPQIITQGITEIWHIHDDGTREQITDFNVSDGKIGFFATGFSVYAIVNAPEPYPGDEHDPVTSVSSLTGPRATSGFYLCYVDSNGVRKYFRNTLNSQNCLRETTELSSAAVWYFEQDGGHYKIYTIVGNAKKYIHSGNGNEVELSADAADSYEISSAPAENTFYLKKSDEAKWLQHSGSGGGIRYWGDNNNAVNSSIRMFFADTGTPPDDYYGLDGKRYGLMNYTVGIEGHALMADGDSNYLSMMTLVVRTDDERQTLFVAEDSDITMWTFHMVYGDVYKLSANVGGTTQYLKISDTVSLADASDASEIRITPKDGKVRLCAGDRYLAFSSDGFFADTDSSSPPAQWMHLAELSGLSQTDYVTYSAEKIGVPDAPDGSSVIVYTRVWNDDIKSYEFYAVDHDGTLYPCYERGDNIMWVGSQINTLLWNLIEYHYDDGSPNYYYELYNPYSRKFIAPQIKDGQVLSDKKIGINLPGRRENEYYTPILAWDNDYYAFSGVRADIGSDKIFSGYRDAADTFYFARVQAPLKTLTKVGTIDNAQYGITMRMIDFPTSSLQNSVLGDTGNTKGLLSTDIKDDGYPVAGKTNKSLSRLFSGASDVNHLFIDSIYNASGYFEFDSCQNFATLVKEDGTIDNQFTVYKELGTGDNTARTTLKHGQFFPYDTITAGVYSSKNPENIYSASAVPGDDEAGVLPESDPRKYEKLHTVGTSPNYYNGMEMSAGFVQTPSGKDSWGHDIVFEFKGDDDFWLYVDKELVIDLGGIHSALSGSVNFATGDVEYDGRKTNLRALYKSNYRKRNPDASAEEVNAYLAGYFNDGEAIFKDYSAHTMHIFYMERGAGASNLHMRFNLSYITPGHVVLTKKVTGSEDVDFNVVEYPYQIWYKDEAEGEEHLLENDDQMISVTYQNSTELVNYREVYTPPNSTRSYRSVYFLNPGKSAEIHFPANTIEYKVIECGVNTEVYDRVSVNGAQVTGESIGNTNRQQFDSGWLRVSDRPTVVYENRVRADALRTLSIQKGLYDKAGNVITAGQDQTTFSYRLYLSNGSDDTLKLANMYKYYVKDPDGYLCRWDAEQQRFAPTGETDIKSIPANQRSAVTFETSMNGAISLIPAWYTVAVPNLPVGTRFRVVERDYEIPLGYRLMGYEREGETYYLEDGSQVNTGWVRANESPKMMVNNQRGWELQARKIWSDAAYVSSHAPIYTAVYVGGRLLDGSVRQMTDPNTSVRYFFDSLEAGKSIDDYEVREAEVIHPVVGPDGVVTGYSRVTPLESGERISVGSVPKESADGAEQSHEYTVAYGKGIPEKTAVGIDGTGNVRSDTITNTRPDGVVITLYDMKTREPLSDGRFTLKHGDSLLGTFTSDAHGRITVLYDMKRGEDYTLTETAPPDRYIGVPHPVVFSLAAGSNSPVVSGNEEKWASGREATRSGASVIAYIDVFNKPFTLEAKKVSSRTGAPLAGAHFALYRTVSVIGGVSKDYDPMPGYGDLVTGEDGVIPKIDNTLDPGTYYLTELTPPEHYEGMSEDIVFTVSDLGFVTVDSEGHGGLLRDSNAEDENAYTILVPNQLIYSPAQLTVTKTVNGTLGSRDQEFRFTLTVEGAEPDERYEWSKNGEAQPVSLRSGGSFTLKDGDTAVITLPEHVSVTVTEDSGEYSASFRLDDGEAEHGSAKTFEVAGNATLAVVNTRNALIPTGLRLNGAWTAVFLLISLACAVLLIMRRVRE